jgi:hypothetical protein
MNNIVTKNKIMNFMRFPAACERSLPVSFPKMNGRKIFTWLDYNTKNECKINRINNFIVRGNAKMLEYEPTGKRSPAVFAVSSNLYYD